MQSALDRRQDMLEHLSDCRQDTIENLMHRYNVSRSTVKRDIEILSRTAPIYTVQGNGGGVRVMDGYYCSRRYLRPEQEALLNKLSDGLQPEDMKVMQSILAAFAKPKVPENKS